MSRDGFAAATALTIGKRAGFECTFPGCGKRTVGPGQGSRGVASIGVAAHICAAAPGGPRYESSQTPEDRAGIENGIWMCQDHARLIDVDVGRFPADLLRRWKADHEARMLAVLGRTAATAITEVAGDHVARGRRGVVGLDISGPAIIRPGTRVLAEGEENVTGTRIGPAKSS